MYNFEDTVAFLLTKVSTSHKNLTEKFVNEIGLHSGQVSVLMELWKTDGLRQIDLAERLNLAAPTVNKILGGLLEKDLVTRGRYEDDARSTRIFLTESGLAARDQVIIQWEKLDLQSTSGLEETEVLILKLILSKLYVQQV